MNLQQLSVKEHAKAITMTGDMELWHIPNINTKEAENIIPVAREIDVQKDGFELMLFAHSVNVVVLDLD